MECLINNVKVTALIDTGSMLSILSQSIFDKLPVNALLHSSDSNACISITGQSLQLRGEFLAHLQLSGSTHSYHIPFLICDNVLAPLGMFMADTLVFEESLHRGPVPLILVSSIIIPARSEVV